MIIIHLVPIEKVDGVATRQGLKVNMSNIVKTNDSLVLYSQSAFIWGMVFSLISASLHHLCFGHYVKSSVIVLMAHYFSLEAALPQKNTSVQNNHLQFHTMTSKKIVHSNYCPVRNKQLPNAFSVRCFIFMIFFFFLRQETYLMRYFLKL